MHPSSTGRPWWPLPAALALTALVAVASVSVAGDAESLGAWWPSAGLAAVTMLLAVRRGAATAAGVAVVLLVLLVLAGLLGGRGPLPATSLAAVDAAEAVVVAVLLERWPGRRLRRLADAGALIAVVIGSAVVGGVGVGVVAASAGQDPLHATTVAALAHTAALLVLVPPLLLDWRQPLPRLGGPVGHAVLTGLVVVLAWGPGSDGLTGLALLVLPLPLLVWAAARFDVRLVSIELAWLALLVSLAVLVDPRSLGSGAQGAATTAQVAQVYVVTLVLLALPLAMALCEREEATRRTRDSEQVFRRAFTQSGLPVLLCRWDGATLRVSVASDACADLLGREPDELVGVDLDTQVSTAALRERLVASPLRDFSGWSGRILLHDAPHRQVEAYCSLLDVEGERGLLSVHLVDLTEHAVLRQSLQQERTRSQTVMDTAASMIVITDDSGVVVSVNPETTRLTGYAAAELVGRPIWETLVTPGARQGVADAVTNLLPLPRSGELTIRTRAGADRTVLFTHAVHVGSPGAPPAIVFSATDVTDARESAGMVDHLLRSVSTLAFVGTDAAGRVTLFSSGAERLFGLHADEARERPVVSLLADVPVPGEEPADAVTLERLVGRGGPEGSPQTRDWMALRPGREPVQVSMTCNPVRTATGSLQTYLFVARDVTETRRNQELMVNALRREREVVTRLQELDRAKDDFISTVSHELRTPMSSIIGSAEMLADGLVGDLEDAQQQLVDVITRNGARLLSLADDLLTLAAFDRGGVVGSVAPLDLGAIVEESVRAVRPARPGGAARRLEWQVDVPDAPVPVVGEESHLERAVTNLLTNAVKFTPDGGSVAVVLRREGAEARVTVSDTGRGITESDLAHVFDRFYRASEVQEHAIQGSGLGLAIVKQIVERHDGRVEISSRHGEGTSISLVLPLARTAAPEVTAPRTSV